MAPDLCSDTGLLSALGSGLPSWVLPIWKRENNTSPSYLQELEAGRGEPIVSDVLPGLTAWWLQGGWGRLRFKRPPPLWWSRERLIWNKSQAGKTPVSCFRYSNP